MSEQFPPAGSLKRGACCDTRGNTTSVLCGKLEFTIRLICSMTNHAVAQPVLDRRIKADCVFSIKMMQIELDMCCAYVSASGQLSRAALFSITLCNESIK